MADPIGAAAEALLARVPQVGGFAEEFRLLVPRIDQKAVLQLSSNQNGDGFVVRPHLMHASSQIPFEIRVACERGPACAAPATIQGMNVKIDPAIPNVKEDIATNRSAYATDYST